MKDKRPSLLRVAQRIAKIFGTNVQSAGYFPTSFGMQIKFRGHYYELEVRNVSSGEIDARLDASK